MPRIIIALCLALLIFVQPLLCCCLAAEIGANAVVSQETKVPLAPTTRCCCESPVTSPAGNEPAPLLPVPQKCPCDMEKPVAQISANASAVSFALKVDLATVLARVSVEMQPALNGTTSSHDTAGAVFPFLDSRDYLNRCHILRC